MKKPDTSKIDQAWPESGLEHVGKCAYCGSAERTLAYKDVQDWSFYCAPGKWSYWDCTACKSLYLDPRPTQATIGVAYGSYYTHAAVSRVSIIKKIKEKIINEYFAFALNVDIKPRLNIPASLRWVLYPIKYKLVIPFGFKALSELPKGKMLDVGCGNGDTVFYAKQIGWQAKGIELDPVAVNAAKSRGLDIVEGTYENLSDYSNEYDCVVCSHVLEHVYDPVKMLQLLSETLKSNGVLILSLPNASSHLRQQFGAYWRGMEAPRHIAIPTVEKIREVLVQLKFKKIHINHNTNKTLKQSELIFKNSMHHKIEDAIKNRKDNNQSNQSNELLNSDFIEIIATK